MRINTPTRFTSAFRTTITKFTLRTRPLRSLLLLGLIAVATTALTSTVASAGSLRQLMASLGFNNAGASSQPKAELAPVPVNSSFMEALQPSDALTVARRAHTATLLADGRVLIVGGENSGGLISQSEIFDPAAGTFSVAGNLSSARADHSATRLADGRLLIAGGRGPAGTLTTTEVFDPTTGNFASGPAMSVARAGHSATLFADGRVLIAGGDRNGSAELLDVTAGSSTAVGSMSSARIMHSAALLQDGRVLIVGGLDADGNELLSCEIFDTPAGTFSAIDGLLKVSRVRAHLRVLFDGKVQIIGGSNDGSMEIYDPLIESVGAYAHVVPESDTCVGLSGQVLASQTRAALFHNGQSDSLLDRSGHTITELSGVSALVAGGGKSDGSTLNSFAVLASSSSSITTDKMDYGPGETVVITGRGFQPGETVRLKIHEDPHTPQERGFDAVADGDGNFAGEYLVQDYDLNMKFIVGARGLSSGWTAQTTFTDAFKADLQGQSAVSTINQTGTGVWIAGNLQNWQEQSLIPMRVHMTGGPVTNQPIVVQFDHTKAQGGAITPGIQDLTGFTASSTSGTLTMTTPVLSAPAGTDVWSYSFNVTLTGNNSAGDVTFNGIMAVGANNFSGSSLALGGSPALGNLQIQKPAGVGSADLSITKTGPSTANPSQTVTYTLNYLNNLTSANSATNTQITDTLPAGLNYVAGSCTGGCTFNSVSKTLTWNLGSLAPGAGGFVTFQATVTASAGTTVTNTGLIQSSAADPNLTDNDSSVSTNITLACTAPNVTTQPTSQSVTYGAASASFTAAAGGSPTPTVQWQVQTGGVGSFTNLSNGAPYSGVTTGTLTITNPTVSLNTNQYRAVFTNTCGGTQTATSNAATLTVNPKTLTASIIGNPTKPYDGNTGATLTSANFSLSGLVDSDNFTVTKTTGSYNSADVASATTVTTSLGAGDFTPNPGTLASNYILPTTASGAGQITKADSTTVITCPVSATYTGSAITPCTVAVTGANLSLTPTPDYSNNINVGTATASYTYAGDANHNGSSDSKTFEITKADSTTVITCPVSATYTGSAITPCTVAVTGANLSLTPTPDYSNNINVGTATASYTYAGDANHNGSSDSKTFEITKADQTITWSNPAAIVYGTALSATQLNATVVGLPGGSAPGALTYTPAAGHVLNAGTGQTLRVDAAATSNYNAAFKEVTIDVTQAELTIKADDKAKIYGANNPNFTFTPSGFVNGDTAATAFTGAPAVSTAATTSSPVGTYTITAAVGSLASSNYSFGYQTGTLSITKANTSTNAVNASAPFGSSSVTLTAGVTNASTSASVNEGTVTFTVKSGTTVLDIISGPVSGGSASASLTLGASYVVGNYTIEAVYSDGTAPINFNGSSDAVPNTLTITAANTTTGLVVSTPVQYSDLVTFTATVSPATLNSQSISGTVQFCINGSPIGGANAVSSSTGVASYSLANQLTPGGSYSVTAKFTSTNVNFSNSNSASAPLVITKENAEIEYTGDTLKSTGSTATNSTTSLMMAGIVREQFNGLPDGYLGDKLNTTQLKFTFFKYTDTFMLTPIVGCTTTNLAYQSPGATSGTATGSCTTGALGADNYTVKVELLVNGFYVAECETVSVTVALGGTGFTTGGGWLTEPNLGTRSNLGFTAKYLKNGNVQGNSLYIYRKTVASNSVANPAGGYLPAGSYNWIIKSNAMLGLTQTGCTTTTPKTCTNSTFTGKSNISAVNRETGIAYSLGGNYQFQVDVTDNGEPGSSASPVPDRYAIRVWDPSTGNYYVLGAPATAAQIPLAGGNIQVRP